MTVHDVLVAARKRIEMPEKWGQGDKDTQGASPKRCVFTALEEVCRGQRFMLQDDARLVFKDAVKTEYVVSWNDAPERTHAEVLAAFDRAIEMAAQE